MIRLGRKGEGGGGLEEKIAWQFILQSLCGQNSQRLPWGFPFQFVYSRFFFLLLLFFIFFFFFFLFFSPFFFFFHA